IASFIRNQMETILLGKPVDRFDDITSYIDNVRKMDAGLSDKIDKAFRLRMPAEARPVHEADRGKSISA
ncbi:MAG TPA: hypothetical protein PLG72_10040, partial [Clostridiales bacterium]|nr:hypothetical protein [Clostridiales bacterium]